MYLGWLGDEMFYLHIESKRLKCTWKTGHEKILPEFVKQERKQY